MVPGRMRTEPIDLPDAPSGADHEDDALIEPPHQPVAEHAEANADESTPAPPEEDFEDFDFDTLDYDSDYQRFMRAGVPEAIKRKALRKLWQSNPTLAVLDGLNDELLLDMVEPVAMPEMIKEWLGNFIDAHHVEEKFIKRRRDKLDLREQKFGKEPIFATGPRQTGGKSHKGNGSDV